MFTFLTKVIVLSGFYIGCSGTVVGLEHTNSIYDETKDFLVYTVDLECVKGNVTYFPTARFNTEELKKIE